MRVPIQNLFYDGLPNAKDIKKIMADNGYQSPYDDLQVHDMAPIDVGGSVGAAPTHGMDLTFNRPQHQRSDNPNGLGEYINTGLGIADSLIPGERIHRNYVTQPLPVYNPYQYGTGSQALMDSGGYVFPNDLIENNQYQYFKENTMPKGYTLPEGFYNGGYIGYNINKANPHGHPKGMHAGGMMVGGHSTYARVVGDDDKILHPNGPSFASGGDINSDVLTILGLTRKGDPDIGDDAKSGNWIQHAVNPKHKGYCTPMTKSTCTPRRKALARTFKKHHGFHEDGGEIAAYGYVSDDGTEIAKYIGGIGRDQFEPGQLQDNRRLATYSNEMAFDGIDLESYDKFNAKSGIHIKPENRGKFNATKKKTGKSTEELTHSSNPVTKKRAIFAQNAAKWHHGKAFDGIDLESYDKFNAASGATVSSAKAKEILRDGTAQGHKLTGKQKKYFGWIAGGKAFDGIDLESYDKFNADNGFPGPGPQGPPGMKQTGTLPYTPQDRSNAYLLDQINHTLATGERTKVTGANSQDQQMLNDAWIWRRINGQHNNPQQNIQGFFNRPTDQNDPMSMYRAKLNSIGYGAGAMYNTTPNMDVRQAAQKATPPVPIAPVQSSMADGGFTEGSIHDLTEEQIAKMLKAGYKFEHFKD